MVWCVNVYFCGVAVANIIMTIKRSGLRAFRQVSSNSEASASELLDNLEEVSSVLHGRCDIINRFKSSNTCLCVTRHERLKTIEGIHFVSVCYKSCKEKHDIKTFSPF